MKVPKFCQECSNRFCKSLSDDSRDRLFDNHVWMNFQKKREQMFFLENKQILIIEYGVVGCFRSNGQNRTQCIDILGPGDLLGCVNLFRGKGREMVEIYPLTDCGGCLISVKDMEKFIIENEDICRSMVAQLSDRYSRLADNLVSRATGDSLMRLEYTLNILREKGVPLEGVSHEVLAMLSGLSRVTVTRTMHTIYRNKPSSDEE